MEDNKGVLEINEGIGEAIVMIPPCTDVETGSSPTSNIKLTKPRTFQRIPKPEVPALNNDTSSSYMRPMSSPVFWELEREDEDEDEDKEVHEATRNLNLQRKKVKKKVALSFIGCIFACLVGILIASLTVHKLKSALIWGLELWKWIVFALVIFCGRLISKWLINTLVFFIKRTGLRKEFVYFVNEMQKSVRPFVWLGLILLPWVLLIYHGLKRSKDTSKILDHVTNAVGGCLIGSAVWLVKNFLIELLASSFQSGRFFDRIQKSIFHQYVVMTLSGPPIMELREDCGFMSSFKGLRSTNIGTAGKSEEGGIDVEKLYRIKQDKISAWTMNALINEIIRSGLSINVCEDDLDEDSKINMKITSELEALHSSSKIFRNVAKCRCKYIKKDDLGMKMWMLSESLMY